MTEEKIVVNAIIEVIGKPKEHIETSLKQYIQKLRSEKGIKVIKEEFSDAEERKDKLFGTFVELQLICDNFEKVVWFTFDYRPASIEIVEPEQFIFNLHTANDYLNDILGKLHNIDMTLQNFAAENKVLRENGIRVSKNFIITGLKKEKKNVDALVTFTGIPKPMLEKFLTVMVKEGKIKKEAELYSLP